MNRIVFFIEDKNSEERNILSCSYYDVADNNNFQKYLNIILPKKELILLFNEVNKLGHHQIVKEKDNSNKKGIIVTFYDVDVDIIDEYIEKSRLYQSILAKDNANNKVKKVVRKNNFQKTIATVGAASLLLLTSYGAFKAHTTNMEAVEDTTEQIDLLEETTYTKINNDFTYTENKQDINELNEEENIQDVLRITADDLTDSNDFFITDAYYREAITKYANMFGIDPNVVLGIAAHERGIHSEIIDAGGGLGLFQIQMRGNWSWEGQSITAYDFEKNEYISEIVSEEKVKDIFFNIKIGCMIFQNNLINNDYNIPMAITEYNYGANNLNKVLTCCSNETGFSITQLHDINNLEWLNYRNIIKNGDPNYLENVLKYIKDGTVLSFSLPNGEKLHIKYENLAFQNNFSKN